MKRAIVLSGGGSKGAYQMGVWKALKKMNLNYDIVTGTSVGALNGALMVQGNYFKGVSLWRQLSFKLLFDKENSDSFKDALNIKDIYKIYAKNIVLSGGLKPEQLENTMYKTINEKKFRDSKIDYGMVTVKVPKYEPLYLTKKDIPKGELIDYLMASATCFPAFQVKKIGDDNFIDGGYYDNMPINLAIDMGADEIIAVDLNVVEIKQPPKKNIKITYIVPNNKLGSFLIFDSKIAKQNIRYGYNDTLKAFGKLEGKKYSFKKGQLENNYYKNKERFIKLAKDLSEFNDKNLLDKIIDNQNLKKICSGNDLQVSKIFNKQVEYLGKVFDLNDSLIYSVNKFNNKLLDRLYQIASLDLKLIEKKIKENEIKDLLHTKIIIKYIYDKINDNDLDKKNVRNLLTIAKFFPKDFLAALYLSSIKYSLFNI